MNSNAAPSQELLTAFANLIEETSLFLARHSINKKAVVSAEAYAKLQSMPPDLIGKTIERGRKILDVHLEFERAGHDFDDSEHLARVALKALGLLTCDEIFGSIRRNDIVEIYNSEHIQIFRSFNFFRICNYGLDDVLLHEWFVLYERNPQVTQSIMTHIENHMKSQNPISRFKIAGHVMKEKFADPQGVFFTRFKFLASTFLGPERRDGFLCTIRGRAMFSDPSRLAFLKV
jgi:hypothetical protein